MSMTHPRRLSRTPPWVLAVVLGVGVVVGYLVIPDPHLRSLLAATWGTLAALLVAAAAILNRPFRRTPWLLLATGLGLMAAAGWAWLLLRQVSGEVPFPSIADALHLMGELFMIAGVLGVLRERVPASDRAGLLDALILAVGFGVVCWVWFMGPMASGVTASGASGSASAVALGVTLAYPIVDVVLLGVLGRLAMSPGRRVASDRLLLLGMATFLVGDLGWAWLENQGQYAPGTPISDAVDAMRLLSLLAFAAAALHPSMCSAVERVAAVPEGLSTRRMLILAGATLLSPAVLLLQASLDQRVDMPVIAIGTLLLFSLVLGRLFLAVAELRRTLGERQALEAELKRQALHDPLTGLANRVLFADRLEHALARRRELVSVLYLDLDDFKTVNDTLGHEAGDEILVRVAARIEDTVRAHDTAARLGGDEFAVLLEESPDLRVAGTIAERLLAALSQPLETHGHAVVIRASIGISQGVSGTTDAAAMMREADIAMYLAKGQGKSRYAVFEPTMHLTVVRGYELRGDLERAAERGQLRLHYQPIVSLASGQPVGVEALLRWEHPARGLLPPLDFVPLAEATGLILPMGRWVIDEACRTLARLVATLGIPDLCMSVNVAPIQLSDPLLVSTVRTALEEHRIQPDSLVLELTETAVPDPAGANRVLESLHDLGVRLAIDDFGSGYSSLGHLGRMPVDIVKLDRAFILSLPADDRSEALAAGVIALGRNLGLQVVAEGIERQDQLDVLRRLACELGQGNHLAPPMPEAELVAALVEDREPAMTLRRQPGAASALMPLR